ncbi:MAG: tetratricopeptide repeat protein [Bradyrhizobium sp.]|nr:tetratricopeptide repeat protein [Bradyrhizobium sp.]
MLPKKQREPRRQSAGGLSPEIANLLNLAVSQLGAGDLHAAREGCRFVLTLVPGQPDALHLLGASFLDEQPDQAEACFQEALASDPRNPLFACSLGLALYNQRKFEEALAMFTKAVRRQTDYREAHIHRGQTLRALGRGDEAIAAFGAALAQDGEDLAALRHRAECLFELGRFGEAVADYDRLLDVAPDDIAALNNRGLALLELRRPAEALTNFDTALAIAPDVAEVVNGRGCALRAMGRSGEALKCFDQSVALNPGYIEAIVNRGCVLQDLGRFDESIRSLVYAQELQPDHARAHWNEAVARLLTGDLATGFKKAEWRLQAAAALHLTVAELAQPRWLGAEPVEGKTIAVHGDLGLGDTIHFARYIPMLAARGARVIAVVQEPLRPLIATMEGVSLCLGMNDRLPAFDMHCPLSSLPLAFGTTLDSIPAPVPYLAPPALGDVWRERLGPPDRSKIGIVWSGNANHVNDRNRSIPLQALRPLFDLDASFVSLQTELRSGDEQVLRGQGNIVAAGPLLSNFADTAALIAALDLVVTVDTSVAHLAGALGRPVWILLPFVPDWRWLLGREDSPWYPSARLFRQGPDRRWEPVVARLKQALADHAINAPG